MGIHGNIFPPSSCSQVGTIWDQNDGVYSGSADSFNAKELAQPPLTHAVVALVI